MTIEEVMAVVKDHTGQDVTPETEISSLGMDSLDFLDLLVRIGNVPDQLVPHLNTVNDLYLATNDL